MKLEVNIRIREYEMCLAACVYPSVLYYPILCCIPRLYVCVSLVYDILPFPRLSLHLIHPSVVKNTNAHPHPTHAPNLNPKINKKTKKNHTRKMKTPQTPSPTISSSSSLTPAANPSKPPRLPILSLAMTLLTSFTSPPTPSLSRNASAVSKHRCASCAETPPAARPPSKVHSVDSSDDMGAASERAYGFASGGGAPLAHMGAPRAVGALVVGGGGMALRSKSVDWDPPWREEEEEDVGVVAERVAADCGGEM